MISEESIVRIARALERIANALENKEEKEEELEQSQRASSLELDLVRTSLKVRTINVLRASHDIRTLGDLVKMSKEEILKTRGLGKAVYADIVLCLDDYGFALK